MSNTERQDVYTRITSKIIDSLEQGVRPWIKPWNAEHAAGRITRPLRHNGQPYSGINVLVLWVSAVEEAGTLEQADVIAALDHAHIDEGPGGPATVAAGQHHVRMNMYIAQVIDGRFQVVEELGAIDPQEQQVSVPTPA